MKELELEKVLKLMRNRNYLNREQLKTVSMAILALSQKAEVNLQEKVVILESKVKKLEEQLKEQHFNTLQPPQIVNQYIQNATITQGPPKRMNIQNVNNNYGMTKDEFDQRLGTSFKTVIEDLKKNEWFQKRKKICEINGEMELIKE